MNLFNATQFVAINALPLQLFCWFLFRSSAEMKSMAAELMQ